jgi:uncharacterized protein (DUF488 family)
MKKPSVFTIGHSTRPIDEFVELLQTYGVKQLVDVRTIPRSRRNPQFNTEVLRESLKQRRIRYRHLGKLGGLRRAKKDSKNLGWRNASFRGYADYMAATDFASGLETLMRIARSKTIAFMCAEAVPWRCHRSLIADALTKKGWMVRHIMTHKSAPLHRPTPFLRVKKGQLFYPPLKT